MSCPAPSLVGLPAVATQRGRRGAVYMLMTWPLLFLYGVIGRLAMPAASYELEATDQDAAAY